MNNTQHPHSATSAEMANAIRVLAMDAVEQAKSGHPGLPMGAADIATVLFTRVMKFDPADPAWPDRDRFVLSAGHGSMLLYAVLHLIGSPEMTVDELKRFRQLGSKTPGHPEYGHTAGVEMTTGPLGQGLATAVGMALAERMMAARFGADLVDHRTYVLASDGDLMEGISQEAIALAGHLKLDRLIVLHDDNGITIDGALSNADSTDQVARFKAVGWAAERIDGHDPEAIAAAVARAQTAGRPSYIACRTTIGFGAPTKAGTEKCHGAPLGAAEIEGARKALNWPHAPFVVPEAILGAWRAAGARHQTTRAAWRERLATAEAARRSAFETAVSGDISATLAPAIESLLAAALAKPQEVATRRSSEIALETLVPAVPALIGGSADLTGSNNTRPKGMAAVTAADYGGRYVNWGIREHAMAAAMNGIALHGGFVPYSGTFLVFADYLRPSLRLAALMGLRVVHVLTHDSIGVGEDGPTHQPIEHIASLRAIPNLSVFRPADLVETIECWSAALQQTRRPSVLALTRQNLPALRLTAETRNLSAGGAYEVRSASAAAKVSLFASGSEVSLAVVARDALEAKGVPTRVVSVPCLDLFLEQPEATRNAVIGQAPVKVAVEAGLRLGWDAVVGADGGFVGLSTFGISAPGPTVFKEMGVTAEAVVAEVERRLKSV